MIVKRIFNKKECLSILSDPQIFQEITEDGGKLENILIDVANHFWLGIYDHGELCGVVFIKPAYSQCYEIHIQILKQHRKKAKKAGLNVLEWCSKNIPSKTLMTNIPVFCKNVRFYVLSLGFKNSGLLPRSWKKNSKIHDMNIFTKVL